MKTSIITETGKGKEIELPEIFSTTIRPDIAQKVYETEKSYSPYAPFYLAGKQHSASGIIKRHRKVWKTGYGHGLSRVPRKIIWRRGTQFNWIGATVANTVGGRRAHPPKVIHFQREMKINKKEKEIALNSGISASGNKNYIKKRYTSLGEIKIELPLVIHSETLKPKKFFEAVKHFAELKNIVFKEKTKRAGHGSKEKYRQNAGLLIVIGNKEKAKINGIDIKKVNEIKIKDFWPLGRLTIYTEEAIKELGGKK